MSEKDQGSGSPTKGKYFKWSIIDVGKNLSEQCASPYLNFLKNKKIVLFCGFAE